MKIKSIAFYNHPILGTTQFDFTDTNGNAIDTIIIAGDNGSGKTTLLNAIYNLSFSEYLNRNYTDLPLVNTMSCVYHVELPAESYSILQSYETTTGILPGSKQTQPLVNMTGDLKLVVNLSNDNYKTIVKLYFEIKGECQNKWVEIGEFAGMLGEVTSQFLRSANLFKCLYSIADSHHIPNMTTDIKSNTLDEKIKGGKKSDGNFATEIKQLLIDINALDAIDLSKWVEKNRGQAPPDNVIAMRKDRFNSAFKALLHDLHFDTVITEDKMKKVIFTKSGKNIEIGNLSSGERHIIFRSAFLLRDQKHMDNSIVLIDEPELSLHPQWQKQILNYYKRLVTDDQGQQFSQLFVSTHSPFIIQNANRYNDIVIVLTKQDENIIADSAPQYPTYGDNDIIFKAYNITDFNNEIPVIYVEGKTDYIYWNRAQSLFSQRSHKYTFKPIGSEDNNGSKNGGDTGLNNAYKFLSNHPPQNKVMLLYDCDSRVNYVNTENVYVYHLENIERPRYKIGIENLLELPADFPYQNFVSTKQVIDDYGNTQQRSTLNKYDLCQYIINQQDQIVREYLHQFQIELAKIESLLFNE